MNRPFEIFQEDDLLPMLYESVDEGEEAKNAE